MSTVTSFITNVLHDQGVSGSQMSNTARVVNIYLIISWSYMIVTSYNFAQAVGAGGGL